MDYDAKPGWNNFLDYISSAPKYSRAQNYVKFVTERKEDEYTALGIRDAGRNIDANIRNLLNPASHGRDQVKAALM